MVFLGKYNLVFHLTRSRIAFTSDRGGGDNIWVMEIDGSDKRQVTNESFRPLNQPTWSPDGRFIVAKKHFTTGRSLGTVSFGSIMFQAWCSNLLNGLILSFRRSWGNPHMLHRAMQFILRATLPWKYLYLCSDPKQWHFRCGPSGMLQLEKLLQQ